ncbi:ABC transporter substrate-binding protein [Reyranella sp. CPCC 100927]|uniref:ABC transporter substrate-binding protein n=1 Tax=Reyranella sp. CPCC 100927 TaxID=2599616 RepID=UPI0015B3FB38|nr:ABC transporter substrate-binding protein [Reyranella sp. CPCC 100927]
MTGNCKRVLGACGVALSIGVASPAVQAQAGDPSILDQAWAIWDGADKPVRGGYLRLAAPQYIGKMNPNHWPVLDWVSMGYVHDKLVVTDGSYNPTVPWLAQSLTQDDPTTVIMKLRDGVTFHDGSRFDASALKFQIDWIRNPKSAAWSAGWLAPLESVEVVDDLTLRWKFKHPWPGFAGIVANVPGYALSAKALREDADAYDSQPKGTGAFMLEEASPGNFLKLKRNPNWWFAKASGRPDMPYFDGIHVSVIPDPAVRLANLRAGKLDILTLDKSQYAVVKNDPNLVVYRQPINHVVALRFNTTKGVFRDARVRQAISLAIDRKALIAGTQFGLGRIASALYPEDHWAHNPALNPVPYDPAKAKQLLAEAGFANGLTIRGYYNATTMGQTIAEAIKNMLAKVGVTWQVDLLAPVAIAARLKERDYDLGEGGWQFIYDPDLAATGLYHPDGGFNFGRSDNKAIVALIEAARREVDHKKRQQLYWDIEKALYDDYQDAWLWWEEVVTAHRKSIKGWNQERMTKYKEVHFWSHPLWFKDGRP